MSRKRKERRRRYAELSHQADLLAKVDPRGKRANLVTLDAVQPDVWDGRIANLFKPKQEGKPQ